MNAKSFTLYSFILLGAEYLLFGAVGLFILIRPDVASMMDAPAPKQEILWAAVHVPKPSVVPPQATVTPADNPIATEEPSPVSDIVDDGSVIPNSSSSEFQEMHDSRWIDVNLSEQQIYAYEGDTVVNSFTVSTGLPDTPTVTGEFNIYVKVPMQDMSGPGYYLRDVPWVMFFYDDYGFHGTYWHNNFGSPMSRGCVNLRTEDAEWLYNWASVGTRVVVHY